MHTKEHEVNQAAFRRMEDTIRSSYPSGQFVAIAGGEIVADAGDFMAIYQTLKKSGRDPRNVLIVQAGHIYPREAVILGIWVFP